MGCDGVTSSSVKGTAVLNFIERLFIWGRRLQGTVIMASLTSSSKSEIFLYVSNRWVGSLMEVTLLYPRMPSFSVLMNQSSMEGMICALKHIIHLVIDENVDIRKLCARYRLAVCRPLALSGIVSVAPGLAGAE